MSMPPAVTTVPRTAPIRVPLLSLIEVTPELIVVAPFEIDDNPYGLEIYHTPGTDTPGHRCAPRNDGICVRCGIVAHLCMNWNRETEAICQSELDAILERRWVCKDCGGAS